MRFTNLRPQVTERYGFTHASLATIPESSGCYVLTSSEGTIMYIGQARNLSRRATQHLDDPAKRVRTKIGYAQWLHFREAALDDLSALERAWADQFKLANKGNLPIFNSIDPPGV